ncbi:MAG: hypothetical protein WA966_13585 [Ornithinimicrobium sp.]
MTVPMEAWVREILRCPVGLHPLVDDRDESGAPVLVCQSDCGAEGRRRQYRIDTGIPVLLADEARLVSVDSGSDGATH